MGNDFLDKSIEERETLFSEIVKELQEENSKLTPLADGELLTVAALELLTGINKLSTDLATENNEEYSERYKHLTSLYGFDDFYSLYVYAEFNSPLGYTTKAGAKDYSGLNKVKRTVVRNGKPIEMDIYEKEDNQNNKDTQKEKEKSNSQSSVTPIISAQTLHTSKEDKSEGTSLKRVSTGILSTNKDPSTQKAIAQAIKEGTYLQDEEGNVRVTYLFTPEDAFLALTSLVIDSTTQGAGIRVFMELLREATTQKLGVRVPAYDNEFAKELFQTFGLTQKKDSWQVTYKDLVKSLGESLPWIG